VIFTSQKNNFFKIFITFFLTSIQLNAFPVIEEKKIAKQKREEIPLPKDFIYKGEPIHPFCFMHDLFSDFYEKSLLSCTPKSQNKWKDELEKDPIRKDALKHFHEGFEDPKTQEFLFYQYLGHLSSGRHLLYIMVGNFNTKGRFSAIGIVQRKKDRISFLPIIVGDRANGGISDVFFKNGILKYRTHVTPRALFDFWQIFSGVSNLSDIDPSTLQDCALCENAAIEWEVPESSLNNLYQPNQIVKIFLSAEKNHLPRSPVLPHPKTLQECFDFAYEERISQGIDSFSLEDLNSFFDQVFSIYRRHNF
jgi:hypothetical protein